MLTPVDLPLTIEEEEIGSPELAAHHLQGLKPVVVGDDRVEAQRREPRVVGARGSKDCSQSIVDAVWHPLEGSSTSTQESTMSTRLDFATLTLMDALDLAVLIELEAHHRYRKFAAQLGHRFAGDAASVFTSMANNEAKHGKELEKRRKAMFGDTPARVSLDDLFDVEAPEDLGQLVVFVPEEDPVGKVPGHRPPPGRARPPPSQKAPRHPPPRRRVTC